MLSSLLDCRRRLWKALKQDFETWTIEHFETASVLLVGNLIDYFKENGVFVNDDNGDEPAKAIYEVTSDDNVDKWAKNVKSEPVKTVEMPPATPLNPAATWTGPMTRSRTQNLESSTETPRPGLLPNLSGQRLYPTRYSDLVPIFGGSASQLSSVCTEVTNESEC